MLTRLKVNGFKNLLDIDIRFGAFTCIAGANGAGKSNLFDAITFLSSLASKSLVESALNVRDQESRSSDIRSIFNRYGDSFASKMDFEVEMIVPKEAYDDLGQKANASITFLRYKLSIGYRETDEASSLGPLELLKEELEHIKLGDAKKHLLFEHSPAWRNSAVQGRRTSPFISTETENGQRIIKVHQDGGSRGRPLSRLASSLPRTVVSAANASESPTVTLAKREMQSWRLLQLEPSALRRPDEFTAPSTLGDNGSHLASTIYRLAHSTPTKDGIYIDIANRLSTLIDDVIDVRVDKDDKRELLTLNVKGKDGTFHPSRSLSDGTLRFLAIAVLEMDPDFVGTLCLEEPENGIHPQRIPSVLKLLRDVATDPIEAVGVDNPLRQVIVNTHSPSVVMNVPDDSLIVAEPKSVIQAGVQTKGVRFSALSDTWRSREDGARSVPKGVLISYLSPVGVDYVPHGTVPGRKISPRVIDRSDIQLYLPLSFDS